VIEQEWHSAGKVLRSATAQLTEEVLDFFAAPRARYSWPFWFDGDLFYSCHELAWAAAELAHFQMSHILDQCDRGQFDMCTLLDAVRLDWGHHWEAQTHFWHHTAVAVIYRENEDAKRCLQSRSVESVPAIVAAYRKRGPRQMKPKPLQEARDQWIFDKCWLGWSHDRILRQLPSQNPLWPKLEDKASVRRIAEAYAIRHQLPLPPHGHPGRRPR
jgi:hypothetical protein